MLAFLFGIYNKEMPHAIAWGISLLVETRPRQTQFASARKTEGISGGHHICIYFRSCIRLNWRSFFFRWWRWGESNPHRREIRRISKECRRNTKEMREQFRLWRSSEARDADTKWLLDSLGVDDLTSYQLNCWNQSECCELYFISLRCIHKAFFKH